VGIGNDEQRHPDLHELSTQVALVKERTRPWKETIALVLAIAAAEVSHYAVHIFLPYVNYKPWADAIGYALAILFLVLGTVAVLGISAKARVVFEPRLGSAHAAVIRYALLLVGVILVVVITLQLFRVPVGQLVVGTALTSVLLGIAAQQSLSNIFAGMVLLLSRPFRVGDPIRLRAGALGGQLEGVVTEIGITYIRLDTGETIMSVPNSQVLAAAVGPIPRQPAQPATPPVPEPENPVTRPPGAGAHVLAPGGDPPEPPAALRARAVVLRRHTGRSPGTRPGSLGRSRAPRRDPLWCPPIAPGHSPGPSARVRWAGNARRPSNRQVLAAVAGPFT
jgi:hypothetical protein